MKVENDIRKILIRNYLPCTVEKSDIHVKVWYKQQLWQKPKEVASKLYYKSPISPDSKFSVNEDFSLTIKETSEDDEGMYFCGQSDGKTFTFFDIIVLAVTGNHITVLTYKLIQNKYLFLYNITIIILYLLYLE